MTVRCEMSCPIAHRPCRRAPRALLAALAFTLACSTVHMPVPPELAEHTELLEARDRSRLGGLASESFELGPYAVKDVDRDWDETDEAGSDSVTTTKTEGGYTYRLGAGALTLAGRCRVRSGKSEVDFGKGFTASAQGFARVECDCGAGASLNLEGDVDSYAGTLSLEGRPYTVRAIMQDDDGWDQKSPVGYRVDGDAPLGAVEVAHPGRVWLRRDLEEAGRAKLSCLFTGLLLYQPPELR